MKLSLYYILMSHTRQKLGNVWKGSIALVLKEYLSAQDPVFLVLGEDKLGRVVSTIEAFEMDPIVLSTQGFTFDAYRVLYSNLDKGSLFVIPLTLLSHKVSVDGSPDILCLKKGSELSLTEFTNKLAGAGFERVDFVEDKCEFARRGSIVDVYDPCMEEPVRIEFSFDHIESVREVDISTQESGKGLDKAAIYLPDSSRRESKEFYRLLPENSIVVFHNHEEMNKDGSLNKLKIKSRQIVETCEAPVGQEDNSRNISVHSLYSFSGDYVNRIDELRKTCNRYGEVYLFCDSDDKQRKISEMFDGFVNIEFKPGTIWRSFRTGTTAYISSYDLLAKQPPQFELLNSNFESGRHRDYSKITQEKDGRELTRRLFDFSEGDFVVHKYLGIARYAGLQKLDTGGRDEERIVLEFYNGVKYLVPVQESDMIHRYYSSDDSPVTLTNVSSDNWLKTKLKARDDIRIFAKQLISQHAKRALSVRPGNKNDGEGNSSFMKEFIDRFSYEETSCQVRAWNAIELDMDSETPMDRVICGDVGFGKTELACRASFKTVLNGRQVVVICPTTILAYQHFMTFSRRFSRFPVNIALLSRFLTGKEQDKVIEGMVDGSLDIVIGTHRLLQDDISIKELGLIVVDEEQRFGVGQKIILQRLRSNTDVLSMSATPIPRTLHMCLSGLRDISILYTPPRNRKPVVTKVARFSAEIIQNAIRKELDRNGQIFILHNNISDLEQLTHFITKLAQPFVGNLSNTHQRAGQAPEKSIATLHGKMDEDQIESTLLEYINGDIRILITTTIIENGIDIPNANTLVITDSHRYGLSQLHQIRGRIGRDVEQGYAYFLFKGNLYGKALDRLKAMEEFSGLGAGFRLSMRDLEIRGAGNLLGKEQHGHIRAIGYDLYVQFLNQEIEKIKSGENVFDIDPEIGMSVTAYIPVEYISSEEKRMDIYKEIFMCNEMEDVDGLEGNMVDKFGRLPDSISNLLWLQRLKLRCKEEKIVKVFEKKGRIILRYIDGTETEVEMTGLQQLFLHLGT